MALKEYDFEKEPTVSVVKKILTDSIKMKATDIHFDPRPNDLLIKFRINGNLVEYTTAPDNVKTNIVTRIKILSSMNITESLLPQIGTINFELEGKTTNMRVSSLPVINGEKLVVHISNYAKNIKSISKIGINPDDVEKIKKLLKEPQGIILITGTTSSGKTTTTYSILKEINSKALNIISIEDPIKMEIEGINQVQIAPDKGLTYKSILKNVLLQDPNVICINELVDDETTRTAVRAAVSGRLVISTLHTKNAYTTIETLLNMDVENYLLGSNLLGIISQRLVKKLCPNCREKQKATTYEKTIIKRILNTDIEELYVPKGCEECQNGYIDQIPVVEVVTIDDELRNAISNNKPHHLIREIIYENNNSILKDTFNKVINGDTTFNEAIRITDIKTDFTEDEKDLKEYILGNGQKSLEEIQKAQDIQENQDAKEKQENLETKNNQEETNNKNSQKQENQQEIVTEKPIPINVENETNEENKKEETQTTQNETKEIGSSINLAEDDNEDDDDFDYNSYISIV